VPAGCVEQHRFHSEILQNERDIWIYRPPGEARSTHPSPWLLLFDGWAYVHLPASVILDNLIAEGCLPPVAAVFVGNAVGARTRELNLNPALNDFLTRELLPWLRKNISLSTDPAQTVIGGASAGGLAAAYTALQSPQVFGNVLAQGGAFWWMPGWDDRRIVPEGSEPGWLIRRYAQAERLPLRFHLDVGIYEIFEPARSLPITGLGINRHMRDVLEAKGYPIHYSEFSGGHDFVGWRGVFPEAVRALLGN
jgi:enterochelin esterase family protein